MLDLDRLTPAQYRARYEELRRSARGGSAQFGPTPSLPALAEGAVRARETVPPGWYVAWRLARGEALRIVNPGGTPGVAVFLWNADDVSERYNAGDTVKLQWTARLTAGRVLFSDMGRVLASITGDTCGRHDTVIGPGSAGPRNGRDNLRLAAGKFGLMRRDLGPALVLFAGVETDDAGRYAWKADPAPGSAVDLRAEMSLLAAISNTPHALAPTPDATGPIEVIRYRAPVPGADDPCRTGTEEAERGFENTDPLFA